MPLQIADYQNYINYTHPTCFDCGEVIKEGEPSIEFYPGMPEVDEPVKLCQTCADKLMELGTPETPYEWQDDTWTPEE